jgi:hypothetical protein
MMRRDFHQHMDMFSRDKTPETIWTPSSLQTCRIIVRIRSRNATSCTLSRYFVMTNCARWRRKSVPVGLRGKGSFEQGNVIGLLLKSTYFFSRVLSGAIS